VNFCLKFNELDLSQSEEDDIFEGKYLDIDLILPTELLIFNSLSSQNGIFDMSSSHALADYLLVQSIINFILQIKVVF
jgi:hypothetical protein